MEQTIQKLPLPIKTKIAAWWMIVIGIIGLVLSIWLIAQNIFGFFRHYSSQEAGWLLVATGIFIIILLFPSLLLLLPGLSLLKRRKWAWWFAIGMMILLIVFSFIAILKYDITGASSAPLIILPIALLPLILLLLDRKNFWKIAT